MEYGPVFVQPLETVTMFVYSNFRVENPSVEHNHKYNCVSFLQLDSKLDDTSLILGWLISLAVKINLMAADVGFRWRWLT